MIPRRPLADLIAASDRAWVTTKQLLSEARNPVVVHERDAERCERVLERLQLGTDSTIGALVYETGGLSFDYGWLRFPAGGSEGVPIDLSHEWSSADQLFVVAYDAVGGFFAVNRGKFPGKVGRVWYLAPDTLEWEDTAEGYSDLLYWAVTGDLDDYYANARWPGWEQEVQALPGDRAFSFYPPLYTQEGKDPAKCSRRAVPVTELWSLHSSGF